MRIALSGSNLTLSFTFSVWRVSISGTQLMFDYSANLSANRETLTDSSLRLDLDFSL